MDCSYCFENFDGRKMAGLNGKYYCIPCFELKMKEQGETLNHLKDLMK